jgi:hypothetical protein
MKLHNLSAVIPSLYLASLTFTVENMKKDAQKMTAARKEPVIQ